jgi:hypothetical protein
MFSNKKIETESHSWCVFEKNVAKKTIDKTLIKESSTGVPLDIVSFFTNNVLLHNERKNITIAVNGGKFSAYLERKKDGRHRLNLAGIKNFIELSANHIRACSLWFEKDANYTELFHVFLDSHIYDSSLHSRNTNKLSQVNTRIGQHVFKARLIEKWDNKCSVTGVLELSPSILIASHAKPWAESNNIERLDGDNGLLLSPHIDKLFDTYRFTFSTTCKLIVSKSINNELLTAWNINKNTQLNLTDNQQYYMDYHRHKFCEINNISSITNR